MSGCLEDVLGRLEGVKRAGAGYMARCPVHDDRCASLSVAAGEGGRVLLFCQAGCKTADVAAALGLSLAAMGHAKDPVGGKAKIVATYDYLDEAGELLYQEVRFEPKGFRHDDPTAQRPGVAPRRRARVLYRLPQVLAAAKTRETIYICEGEKDGKALERAGCVATCNSGGAGKWRREYSEACAAANVVIVADNDDPGASTRPQVAAPCRASPPRLASSQARRGKDAADHLAAGLGPRGVRAASALAQAHGRGGIRPGARSRPGASAATKPRTPV